MVTHTAQRQLIRTYCLCIVSAITWNVQGWHFTIHVTSLTWLVLRHLLTTSLLGQKEMTTKLLIFWVHLLEVLLNNLPLLYPHSNVEIQFIVCKKSTGLTSLSLWLKNSEKLKELPLTPPRTQVLLNSFMDSTSKLTEAFKRPQRKDLCSNPDFQHVSQCTWNILTPSKYQREKHLTLAQKLNQEI